jgi:hypothetical protein
MANFGTPVIKGTRPYFEAKLKDGAIASVAQMTGTATRTTLATGAATATTLAQYVMALVQDLQSRGIIQ